MPALPNEGGRLKSAAARLFASAADPPYLGDFRRPELEVWLRTVLQDSSCRADPAFLQFVDAPQPEIRVVHAEYMQLLHRQAAIERTAQQAAVAQAAMHDASTRTLAAEATRVTAALRQLRAELAAKAEQANTGSGAGIAAVPTAEMVEIHMVARDQAARATHRLPPGPAGTHEEATATWAAVADQIRQRAAAIDNFARW
eukprot:SAG11_NODE_8005_length_1071_cov_1.170782_1_plen_200_part_00